MRRTLRGRLGSNRVWLYARPAASAFAFVVRAPDISQSHKLYTQAGKRTTLCRRIWNIKRLGRRGTPQCQRLQKLLRSSCDSKASRSGIQQTRGTESTPAAARCCWQLGPAAMRRVPPWTRHAAARQINAAARLHPYPWAAAKKQALILIHMTTIIARVRGCGMSGMCLPWMRVVRKPRHV